MDEQIAAAVERVDQLGLGKRERHGVDGEVAPREVRLDRVRVDDVRLARIGSVRLGAMCRDLERPLAVLDADRAEPFALRPDRVGPVRTTSCFVSPAGRRS